MLKSGYTVTSQQTIDWILQIMAEFWRQSTEGDLKSSRTWLKWYQCLLMEVLWRACVYADTHQTVTVTGW